MLRGELTPCPSVNIRGSLKRPPCYSVYLHSQ